MKLEIVISNAETLELAAGEEMVATANLVVLAEPAEKDPEMAVVVTAVTAAEAATAVVAAEEQADTATEYIRTIQESPRAPTHMAVGTLAAVEVAASLQEIAVGEELMV